MKRTVILAAALAALAAPAFANSTAFAIQHFNQDQDSIQDRVTVPSGDNSVFVSTRNASGLSTAFDIVNGSADNVGDLRGLNGATVYNGTPAYGADIFAELREAAREDE